LPVFRFDRAIGMVQRVRAFLNLEGSAVPNAAPNAGRHEDQAANSRRVRRRMSERNKKFRDTRRRLKSKRQELQQTKDEFRIMKDRGIADDASIHEHKNRKIRVQQEIFELQRELRAAKELQAEDESRAGSLPDFVIIGAQKCGTSFFYDVLSRHPHIQPAALKELHYFDRRFEEGIEWYRRCFPPPRLKDGRKTITGEATPYYLFHPLVPERMAEVIPEARLISMLRNPVDRAYSAYQQQVRKGREPLSFEEAIEAEEARLRGEEGKISEDEHYISHVHRRFSYLARGIYVDQLLRWSEFFPREQMLVLKSEDLFESSRETLKSVLTFLDLPEWEPEARRVPNKGDYTSMAPATRRRLEEYFEPHNQRLYKYLGVDFGW
jgi:hypothetical protein